MVATALTAHTGSVGATVNVDTDGCVSGMVAGTVSRRQEDVPVLWNGMEVVVELGRWPMSLSFSIRECSSHM